MTDPSQPPPYPPQHDPNQPPPYAQHYPPGYAPYPMARPTNGLAIAAMVVSLVGFGPVGAIMGHVARGQIRRTGEQGDGFALAAIIVGWVVTCMWVVWLAVAIAVFSRVGLPTLG